MGSADFERGDGDGGEGGSEEPKTDYDLWFTPAGQVEMVVNGGASEKAFTAGIFEIADLQDYTK